MRKSEANLIAAAQLVEWTERNRFPGTLPCVPVILINSLCGKQSGIVMNLAKGMSLNDTLKLLKVATEQVEKQIQGTGNQTLPA